MAKRKTVDVDWVKKLVNDMLATGAYDDDKHRQFRMGALTVLDEILHTTGNYRGYRYLMKDELLLGCKPGVNYVDNGNGALVPHPHIEERFKDTDDSRRHYH